jgi:hypothetical protein
MPMLQVPAVDNVATRPEWAPAGAKRFVPGEPVGRLQLERSQKQVDDEILIIGGEEANP